MLTISIQCGSLVLFFLERWNNNEAPYSSWFITMSTSLKKKKLLTLVPSWGPHAQTVYEKQHYPPLCKNIPLLGLHASIFRLKPASQPSIRKVLQGDWGGGIKGSSPGVTCRVGLTCIGGPVKRHARARHAGCAEARPHFPDKSDGRRSSKCKSLIQTFAAVATGTAYGEALRHPIKSAQRVDNLSAPSVN